MSVGHFPPCFSGQSLEARFGQSTFLIFNSFASERQQVAQRCLNGIKEVWDFGRRSSRQSLQEIEDKIHQKLLYPATGLKGSAEGRRLLGVGQINEISLSAISKNVSTEEGAGILMVFNLRGNFRYGEFFKLWEEILRIVLVSEKL